MYIDSLKKEVTIGVKTRKISRLVNEELMRGVIVTDIATNKMDFPVNNIDKSTELMVRLMTGLSQEETDSLTEKEYNELKSEIEKAQDTPR